MSLLVYREAMRTVSYTMSLCERWTAGARAVCVCGFFSRTPGRPCAAHVFRRRSGSAGFSAVSRRKTRRAVRERVRVRVRARRRVYTIILYRIAAALHSGWWCDA